MTDWFGRLWAAASTPGWANPPMTVKVVDFLVFGGLLAVLTFVGGFASVLLAFFFGFQWTWIAMLRSSLRTKPNWREIRANLGFFGRVML